MNSVNEWSVPEGWRQGRGAWGGYAITAMAEHVEQLEDPSRVLRTLSAQIMEPVTVGDYLMQTKCLREGSALSTWAVTITRYQDRVLVAQSQIITGAPTIMRCRRFQLPASQPFPPSFMLCDQHCVCMMDSVAHMSRHKRTCLFLWHDVSSAGCLGPQLRSFAVCCFPRWK